MKDYGITLKGGETVSPEELLTLPMFKGISPSLLQRNKGAVVRRRFKPGEIICREGEYGSTAFYILEGRAEVFLANPVAHVKTEGGASGFLSRLKSSLSRKNPSEISRNPVRERRLPDSPPPPLPPRSATEWVERELATAQTLLWRKTCAECHTLVPQSAGRPPRVTEPNITQVWMHQARFDHETHRMLDCAACHSAAQSQETADLLLPGIATCQQCHFAGDTSAGDSCSLCHTYHDWSRAKRTPGRFSLDKLLRGTSE